MGDVALTLPALRGALDNNPELKITILTRGFFAPFFANIDRLSVFTPDLNNTHKGIKGLSKLFKELKELKFDLIIDLHAVIRSRYLATRFKLHGTKVYSIKKDRREKKSYLKSNVEPNLKTSIQRYVDVLNNVGVNCTAATGALFNVSEELDNDADQFINNNSLKEKTLVGIAPFAKHKLKMWPLQKVEELIKHFGQNPKIQVILFGGGKEELQKLVILSDKFENCLIPKVSFPTELAIISKLSAMISMDSSNMHLAALSGIPVISIWGATHPGIGFSAWNQPIENSIQIPKNELECRPCTIYGKGECRRSDFACMERISALDVYKRTILVLELKI